MRDIPIHLYSGAGNEFVIIDAFNEPLIFGKVKLGNLAATVCSRTGLVGADGMIVIARSAKAAFQMNFYNPDGSFGALCGNGARCAVAAAFDFGIIPSKTTSFDVLGNVVTAEETTGGNIRVHYADPKHIKLRFKLSLGSKLVNCHYVDLGSQHAVMFFDEIEQLHGSTIEDFDINWYGSAVRNHPDFAPLGANANFIRIQSDDDGDYIRIRTFERGVEGETPACGTGCMSSAITAYGLGRISSMPIRLKVQSGEFVTVGFEVMEDRVRDLWLEGSARRLRSGILSVAEE